MPPTVFLCISGSFRGCLSKVLLLWEDEWVPMHAVAGSRQPASHSYLTLTCAIGQSIQLALTTENKRSLTLLMASEVLLPSKVGRLMRKARLMAIE